MPDRPDNPAAEDAATIQALTAAARVSDDPDTPEDVKELVNRLIPPSPDPGP